MLCALLRVRMRVVGEPVQRPPAADRRPITSPGLDIPVISSIAPVVFVAKSEVAAGRWSASPRALQRTVFVDRARRQQTGEVNAEIAERLGRRRPGRAVRRRHLERRQPRAAVPLRADRRGGATPLRRRRARDILIQPLSIGYTGLQGMPMGRQHRPLVAWYGDLDFMPHFKAFIARGAVDVVVTCGEPIAADGATDRKAMAKTAGRRGAPRSPWRRCADGRGRRMPPSERHSFLRRKDAKTAPFGMAGLVPASTF